MEEMPQVAVVDCATGEQIVRPMTDEEISVRNAMIEAMQAQRIAEEEAEAAKLAAKESAVSKLSSLGLTEEEIQALVG